MFVNAIETAEKYTRSIHFISRQFESTEVIPGTATLFFVNEKGVAITCKHVADELLKCKGINDLYEKYKNEICSLPDDENKESAQNAIASKYGYTPQITAEYRSLFYDCVKPNSDGISFSVKKHPIYDLAIIEITNSISNHYQNYAVFAKDSSTLRQGEFLCRIGYPFPEFSNYQYDAINDKIEWTSSGRNSTPMFPIEGMFTRKVTLSGEVFAYELSTPGLRGQSGGPLFNKDGIVYGMQSETAFLHLGFDQDKASVRINGEKREVENHPFLHVGRCICVDIIKKFLDDNNIKYYVGETTTNIEVVNG